MTDTIGQELLRTSVLRDGGRTPRRAFDEVALLRRLEKEYDLGDWLRWSPTVLGASNVSWFVETEHGDVVVRRSHDLKTVQAARFEQALIDHLVSRGFPAPLVLPTRTGAGCLVVDGLVHMVMRRLPGSSYDRESPAHLAEAAHGLGRFHALVHDLPTDQDAATSSTLTVVSPAARRRVEAALAVVEPMLADERRTEARRDVDRLVSDMATIHDQLGAMLPELTYLITHGSYGPTSVLLTDDRLTGVLDLDRSAHDLLCLDLAYATWQFCSPSARRRKELGVDPELLAAFLAHYRTQVPVTTADLEAVPTSLLARRLVRLTKKSENLLHKHALAPRNADDADAFARMLSAEADRSRWLDQHRADLTRALPHTP